MTVPSKPFVDDLHESIFNKLVEIERIGASDKSAMPAGGKTDSPLESAMFAALTEFGFSQTDESGKEGIARLYQQFPVVTPTGTFRLDLAAIRRVGRHVLSLAIECDGYEFHHATKEQVELDNRRDRALVRAGWRVVRYSGSEIHRDASMCALDAAGIVIDWVDAVSRFSK